MGFLKRLSTNMKNPVARTSLAETLEWPHLPRKSMKGAGLDATAVEDRGKGKGDEPKGFWGELGVGGVEG
jgi:hypothetical protein